MPACSIAVRAVHGAGAELSVLDMPCAASPAQTVIDASTGHLPSLQLTATLIVSLCLTILARYTGTLALHGARLKPVMSCHITLSPVIARHGRVSGLLVVQWLGVGLVIERSLSSTPGRGAIKSTMSTQPSIPPG